MERLTCKKEADAQREAYEVRLTQGYPRNIPEERFLRLAAYEDTGLEPEEIVKMGMAWEDSKRYSGRLELKLKAYQELGTIAHLRELVQAEAALEGGSEK